MAAEPAPPGKDARFRRYRGLAWAVYLTVAIGFSLLITGSVMKSTFDMTPKRPSLAGETLSVAECLGQVEGLFAELEGRRQGLAAGEQVRGTDQAWAGFRVAWLTRERELEARCAPEAAGRQHLRRVFSTLETVLDVYTTQVTLYSNGVGPRVDAFRAAVKASREAR